MAITVDELISVLRWKVDDAQFKAHKRQVVGYQGNVRNTIGMLGSLRRAMLEAWAARAIASGAKATIGFVVETNKKFETLQARLHTLTGSEAGARKVFDMIREFAVKTPFEVGEISESYATLRSAGIIPTMDLLRDFGDMAGGMGRRLSDVAVAVRAALSGEMEPLANSLGIKMLVEGDKLRASFNGTTTLIERNSGAIVRYLREVAQEKFTGGMERQSKTLAGAMSNAVDAAEGLALKVGERGLMTVLKETTLHVTDLLTSSDDLAIGLGEGLAGAAEMAQAWLYELIDAAQGLTKQDVEEWIKTQADRLADLISIGADLVKFLDSVVDKAGGVETAVKAMATAWAALKLVTLVQGLAGVATQLRAVGLAASVASGPWGIIVASFAALVPVLEQLNLEQRQLAGSVRRTREGAPKSLGEMIESGEMTREQAVRKSKLEKEREAARAKFETVDTEIARDMWRERFDKSSDEIKALEREIDEGKRKRDRIASARDREVAERKKNAKHLAEQLSFVAKLEGLKVPKAKERVFMDELERAVAEGADDDDALQQAKLALNDIGVRKAKKKGSKADSAFEAAVIARKNEMVGKVELSAGAAAEGASNAERNRLAKEAGKLERARIDAELERGNLAVLGMDFLAQSSEFLERVKARVDDLSGQAALSASLRAQGTATQRAAAGEAAGAKRRAFLDDAVSRGRFDLLGGEFSAANQQLRDLGLVDEALQVPSPVLSVVNQKYDVNVAGTTVNFANAPGSSPEQVRKVVDDAVQTSWRTNIRRDLEAHPIRQVR